MGLKFELAMIRGSSRAIKHNELIVDQGCTSMEREPLSGKTLTHILS
jgi:hypothetical protein